MEGMRAYQCYMALKLHFTSNYDYFKYGGKTRAISEESFRVRKDVHHFQRLERRYKDQIEEFFIANFVMNPNAKWIGDLTGNDADRLFRDWQKTQQSFRYTMKNELEGIDLQKAFRVHDGKHPEFLRAFLAKKVSLGTFLACETVIGFMDKWNERIEDQHIWPTVRDKVLKYKPFFERLGYSKKELAGVISNAISN